MSFTLDFLNLLSQMIVLSWPLLFVLISCITTLALFVGRIEKWETIDSVYYGFITATTVGYGDIRPTQSSSKMLAIAIALTGMILTGIVVALAVESMMGAAEAHNMRADL